MDNHVVDVWTECIVRILNFIKQGLFLLFDKAAPLLYHIVTIYGCDVRLGSIGIFLRVIKFPEIVAVVCFVVFPKVFHALPVVNDDKGWEEG